MRSSLIKGLTDEQQIEMRQAFGSALVVRRKIAEVLKAKVETNNKLTRSKDAYGIANWDYLQADAVGYERALTEVLDLLDVSNVETTSPTVPQKRKYTRKPKTNLLT